MELIVSSAFLLAACACIWVWQRQRRQHAEQTSDQDDHGFKLPDLGEPGSVTPQDLKVLKQAGVDFFDPGQISTEQARVLVDCIRYIDEIWQTEFQAYGPETPNALRQTALHAILRRKSYRDYVVMLEERPGRTEPGELPRDGCYRHVFGLLAEGISG